MIKMATQNLVSTILNQDKVQEYKIAKIVVTSDMKSVYTGNYINHSEDNKCDNLDDFKILINELYPSFKSDMMISIRDTAIESGVHYTFEDKFNEIFEKNPYLAIQMLQRFLRDFYNNSRIVKAVLHIVSHYSYEELGEIFQYSILSLVGHRDKGIKKFALKVFDNWDSVDTINLLKGTDELRERWLNDYKEKILKRLEGKKTDAVLFARD